MRVVVVAAVLLLAPLAGCIQEPAAEMERSDAVASGTDVAAAMEGAIPNESDAALVEADVPSWSVGDAWAVTSHSGDETASLVLAVVAADSGSYTMATNDEETAALDAMIDISYLGRIRASDLAGSQHETPVRFFDFPLSDGKTWTTTWDGREIKLTATLDAAIQTPLGPQPGFRIQGTDGEAPYVSYTYVPALEWWSHIAFEEGYGLTVDRRIENWTGSYVTATAKLLFEAWSEAPFGMHGTGAFTVDEGQTSLVLIVMGHANQNARALALTDPAGTPVVVLGPHGSTSPEGFWNVHHLSPTPGDWHIAAPALHDPEGRVHVQVQQVATEEKALALP